MAYKYNNSTGEFEPVPEKNKTNPPKSHRSFGANLFLSLIYAFLSWVVFFFVIVALFGNSSNDTQESLVVVSFIVAGVTFFYSLFKLQD